MEYERAGATPTPAQVERFRARGWLALEAAIDAAELAELSARVQRVIEAPRELAFDPSQLPREPGAPPVAPSLHSTLSLVWLDWRQARFHTWARAFAAALAGRALEFWYDQLLLKPPREGAETPWHQDDAYMGALDQDLMLSCWLALDDVTPDMGCLEFLDGGHREGIIEALRARPDQPPTDWEPDDPARVSACPLPAGGVTFHLGKTPHRAGPNRADRWRRAFIQRFSFGGAPSPRCGGGRPGG